MTKTITITLALVLGLSAGSVLAQTRTPAQLDSYIYDTRGEIWRSGTGLCWRTARWTPAGAVRECDPDLFGDNVGVITYPPVVTPEEPRVPETQVIRNTYSADTFFDFDKSVIKPAGKQALDDLANRLRVVDLELVIATGHTDSIGTAAYNQKLSIRRATAVKNYLVSKGIPADQIKIDGKGETQPIASNKTRDGRARNRRVEVVVYGYETITR